MSRAKPPRDAIELVIPDADPKNCLHCAVQAAIARFAMKHGGELSLEDIMGALTAVIADYLAPMDAEGRATVAADLPRHVTHDLARIDAQQPRGMC